MRAQDLFKAAVALALSAFASGAPAADIDREAVDFTAPEHIRWVRLSLIHI